MAKGIKTTDGTVMVRVSNRYRCPICGKSDWCLFAQDGSRAVCMRNIDTSLPELFGGSVYQLDSSKTIEEVNTFESQPLAKSNVLHKVYSLVISTLGLTPEHFRHLTEVRHLAEEEVIVRGYASVTTETLRNQIDTSSRGNATIWEELFVKNNLPADAWKGVPGFWYDAQNNTPIFECQKGILIPCRNAWGQIVGMQIRVDEAAIQHLAKVTTPDDDFRVNIVNREGTLEYTVYQLPEFKMMYSGKVTEKQVVCPNGLEFKVVSGPKYVFVSSTYKNLGTSAKVAVHYSYPLEVLKKAVFDANGNSRRFLLKEVKNSIVTEGLLKADIISALKGNSRLSRIGESVVMAMPGVSSWKKVSYELKRTGFQNTFLAFDQDFESNETVFSSLKNMVHDLTKVKKIITTVLIWEEQKGLDDLIIANPNASISTYTYKVV